MTTTRATLFDTTRPGMPALWGQAEIVDYAEFVAEDYPQLYSPGQDGRRIPRHRVKKWVKLPSFPEPLAQLQMGPVFLVEEVAPWVESHISKPIRTAPITPQVTKAVLGDKGKLTGTQAAAKHGVSLSTVTRIWRREE